MRGYVRQLYAASAFALMLTACLDHHPDTDPGELPPGGSPPGPGAVLKATSDGAAPLTTWQAGDVPLGARATISVFITNIGGAPTRPLLLSLGGANASEFSIDATQSTCGELELAASAQCNIALVFAPTGTATGARTAQLEVSGAVIGLPIELRGNATPAVHGIAVDMASLDLGPRQIQAHADGNLVVTNTGATDLTLTRPRVTGDASFEVLAFDCGASLAPGASCTITVQFAPTLAGAVHGTLILASSTNTATVQLAGVGVRRVVVTSIGPGGVAAVPNNFACDGTTCDGLFPGDVTLTATPTGDATFAGWSPVCGANPTCTLPRDRSPMIQLSATFTAAPPR